MVSKTGFIDLFWEQVRDDRKAGGRKSYQQIYREMEEAFEADFKVTRFPSYDAFRKIRDRLSQR